MVFAITRVKESGKLSEKVKKDADKRLSPSQPRPQLCRSPHRSQLRKGTRRGDDPYNEQLGLGVPYLAHAVGVGMLFREHGAPEHVVAAGILHNVLENAPATYAMLQEAFSLEIANLVRAESEPDKSLH